MKPLRKPLFVAAGYTTTFMGKGRPEFHPKNPQRPFIEYLRETSEGTLVQIGEPNIDEGIIGSFMSARFIHQANLGGFLPELIPTLLGKPCTAVEGACGTGGRALAMGARAILSEMSDAVFVCAFEMQNSLRAVYGADVLAGAAYYDQDRKTGEAHFFPGIFSKRAGAYFQKHDEEKARRAMAKWYEQMILNARKNPKAQEYHNSSSNLFAMGMTPPDPQRFIPHLNVFNCSKVSDGAASLLILSEEGLKKCGIAKEHTVEIIGIGGAEANITKNPPDPLRLMNTEIAVQKALAMAQISIEEIALMELHDCFGITAILAMEALGLTTNGVQYILDGRASNANLSGGLSGFGHPTGATGVRQMVDLLHQFTRKAANQQKTQTPYGLMISMGGNDITTTAIITKQS